MEYSTLSKEEKADIFEAVNSTHLNLTGNQKKLLKRSFTHTWKLNKNMGAFELFMKLYESEDLYDSRCEFFKKYVEEDYFTADHYRTRKPVPYAKHRRHMSFKSEEIEELEKKLEDWVTGKSGYISQENHEELMKTQLEEQQEIIRSKSDEIGKWKNKAAGEAEKRVYEVTAAEKQRDYFEEQLNKLSKNQD
jgi:hypothetical protein